MYRLTTPHSTLTYHNGTLIFTDTRTGKTMTLGGGDEFVLYLCDRDGETHVLRDRDFTLAKTDYIKGRVLSFDYKRESLFVSVGYFADGDVFQKHILVKDEDGTYKTLRRITTENRTASAPVARGGEGQPVFIGDETTAKLFCGTEFPVACNLHEENTLCFTQAPYVSLDTPYCAMPVTYGLDSCGDLAATFLAHMQAQSIAKEPLRIYNDWGLHDDLTPGDPILTAEMTLENIPRVAEMNRKSDANFDYYLMDAFWFEKGHPYTHIRPDTFPEGMAPIKAALDEAGLKFGLWFDINGIHTSLAELPELAKYNTELGNGALCLACDEVADLICDGMEKQVRELGLKIIKLDFGYFECKNPHHNHSTATDESKEKSVRNFIDMMNRLRKMEPELKILCYNGWMTDLGWMGTPDPDRRGYPVSPYWCKYVDYVYCGDPRPSEFPSANAADSLVWYADGMIKLFADGLMPLDAIDDAGAMMGHTGTIYHLGKKHFRESMLMAVLRGGKKLLIYGDLRDLDDSDYAYLGFVDTLYSRAMAGNYTTRIFGNAARGEVYGYDTGADTEGLCVVVNPTAHDVIYNLASPRWQNGVSVTPVIVNGEIVSPDWQETGTATQVKVTACGYTLIEWKLTPAPKGFDKITLLPGDRITINTTGSTALELSFRKDGAPLRTADGLPPEFTVTSKGKPLTPSQTRPVWSGISWVYYALKNCSAVTLTYEGDLVLTLKYQLS